MRQVLLINPYNVPQPRKIIEEAAALTMIDGVTVAKDKYEIIEIPEMPTDTLLPSGIKNTIIIWFFASADQLESKIIKIRKFVKRFEDSFTPIAIIAPDVVMGLSKRIKFIKINQAAEAFRKIADSYFGAIELATNIKYDIYDRQKIESKDMQKSSTDLPTLNPNISFEEHLSNHRKSFSEADELKAIRPGSPERKFKNWFETKQDEEMDASAQKITNIIEREAIMKDICGLSPVINYWTKSEEFVNKTVIGIDQKKLSISLNNNLKKIINDNEKVLFFRGNHQDGGIYFYIENLKQQLVDQSLKTNPPDIIWKIERRKSKRLQFLPVEKFKVSIHLFLMGKVKCFVREALGISDGGIMVGLASKDLQNFTPGTKVKLLSFKINGNDISCSGKVIWCRDTSFKTISNRKRIKSGIIFIGLLEEDRKFIEEYVINKFIDTGSKPI